MKPQAMTFNNPGEDVFTFNNAGGDLFTFNNPNDVEAKNKELLTFTSPTSSKPTTLGVSPPYQPYQHPSASPTYHSALSPTYHSAIASATSGASDQPYFTFPSPSATPSVKGEEFSGLSVKGPRPNSSRRSVSSLNLSLKSPVPLTPNRLRAADQDDFVGSPYSDNEDHPHEDHAFCIRKSCEHHRERGTRSRANSNASTAGTLPPFSIRKSSELMRENSRSRSNSKADPPPFSIRKSNEMLRSNSARRKSGEMSRKTSNGTLRSVTIGNGRPSGEGYDMPPLPRPRANSNPNRPDIGAEPGDAYTPFSRRKSRSLRSTKERNYEDPNAPQMPKKAVVIE
jgi:hypothetical protein